MIGLMVCVCDDVGEGDDDELAVAVDTCFSECVKDIISKHQRLRKNLHVPAKRIEA